MASSLLAVDRILDRGSNYREAITKNHTLSKLLAECMAPDGTLEQSVLQVVEDDPALKEELQKSFQEQRDRLKKVAEKNVQNGRNVDAFIGALQAVRTQVQTHQETDEPPDYEKIINDKMQEYTASQKANQLDLKDEQYCRDIRAALGEKEAARKNDESDEELEVLRNPNSSESLKCPVMGKLVEDPLRSKVCGHVYSRVGIEQLLHQNRHRGGKIRCPVAGCSNSAVTREQLEEDHEAAMKVRRLKRREANEREQRMTQEIDGDSDEEEL